MGGNFPRWRGGGKELFYRALDGHVMVVPVSANAQGLSFSRPSALLRIPEPQGSHAYPYDVSKDGQRILTLAPDEGNAYPLTVLTNWFAAIKK